MTAPPGDTLIVRPWPDEVIDRLGHDPRSSYVERFWLSLLGPSTTWLLRRLAAGFDACPAGFELDLAVTGRALGLGASTATSSPLSRSLVRLCRFGLAVRVGPGELAVRRRVPPLSQRQLRRLPDELADEHQRWSAASLEQADRDRLQRARRLALSLMELGETTETTERQLLAWRYPPQVTRRATAWALDRHRGTSSEGGEVELVEAS